MNFYSRLVRHWYVAGMWLVYRLQFDPTCTQKKANATMATSPVEWTAGQNRKAMDMRPEDLETPAHPLKKALKAKGYKLHHLVNWLQQNGHPTSQGTLCSRLNGRSHMPETMERALYTLLADSAAA